MLLRRVLSGCLLAGLLWAAEGDWAKKKASDWTQDDAHELLTSSPWAKSADPEYKPQSNMGRGGISVGAGGLGVGTPGMGRRGGGSMGRREPQREPRAEDKPQSKPVIVRWESALPIQEAELKARNTSAPEMEEGSYAIVISGLPSRIIQGDKLPKPHGELRRDGQKPIKATDARVLPRDDGPLVIFFFSRTKEIVPGDKTIEFDGEVGPFHVKQAFSLEDMVYLGQLAL